MSNDDDWVEGLIALGIGALAVYFLAKIVSSDKENSKISVCPYCGSSIKKWAIECPVCRKKLRGP